MATLFDACLTLPLAGDVVWREPGPTPTIPWAGTWQRREGVEKWLGVLGRTLQVEKLEPREFIAQGDHVVVLGAERARIKETGRTYDSDFAMVFTLREGKIAEFRAYHDTAAIVEAARA